MLNIVHVGLSHNPGGVENMVMNYYRNIDRNRVHFDFIDIYGNGIAYSDEIQLLGGKVYLLPNYKKHPAQFYKKTKQILQSKDIDIVHVHMQSTANLLPIFAGLAENRIVIAHSHSSATPTGMLRKALHCINTRILRKLPVQRWACGVTAGKWMHGDCFCEEDTIVNAIDMKRYRADTRIRKICRTQCQFNRNDKVIGFVGRFGEEKNPMFLLDVLEELRKTSDDYKLLVIGGGDLFAEFEQRAKEKKLKEFIFSAGVQRDTAYWYQAMDAFLLPSAFEGFPVVAVEAQAMNLPCCFSDRITHEVDLSGRNKFITIDGADAAIQWAEAIEQMLKYSGNRTCDNEDLKKYDIVHGAENLLQKYSILLDNVGNKEIT